MGFSKEEKSKRVLRIVKTLFFLITMLISLLLFSAPVLLVITDTLLPSAILSASLSPHNTASFSNSLLETLSYHFKNYDFRYSLIDIPIISIFRSAVIICKYENTNLIALFSKTVFNPVFETLINMIFFFF